jgi:hypothetical protein
MAEREKPNSWQWLLEGLNLSRYRFEFKTCYSLWLPPFPGSMLRGSFGRALKQTVCIHQGSECASCLAGQSCSYQKIFETSPGKESGVMGKADAVPHPFILEVKPGEGRRLEAGERFGFDMWLVGDADAFAPFVIYAVERMGELGFGADAVPCRLFRADVVLPDRSSKVILKDGQAVGALEKSLFPLMEWPTGAAGLNENGLTLTFETPLRIKHEGRLVRELPFRLLLQHLERRARLTASLHGKLPLSAPDDDLIQLASDIRVEENRLRWFDWERYSSRQDATMKLGGLMGSICYDGDPAPFQALLHAGEILHIGKGTSFGLGKYVIKNSI